MAFSKPHSLENMWVKFFELIAYLPLNVIPPTCCTHKIKSCGEIGLEFWAIPAPKSTDWKKGSISLEYPVFYYFSTGKRNRERIADFSCGKFDAIPHLKLKDSFTIYVSIYAIYTYYHLSAEQGKGYQ